MRTTKVRKHKRRKRTGGSTIVSKHKRRLKTSRNTKHKKKEAEGGRIKVARELGKSTGKGAVFYALRR
ncbi:unnamed protein product [marine sediment metagenome]|uniref:Uncharacterized protein n=1 Tax=marine sediment metagenome TaxID=412755 RepID=X1BZG1_9ZZZZ